VEPPEIWGVSISSKSFSGNQTKRCGPQNLCNTRAGVSGFPTLVDIRLNEGDFFSLFLLFFRPHTSVKFPLCTFRSLHVANFADLLRGIARCLHIGFRFHPPKGFHGKNCLPKFWGSTMAFFRKKGQRTPCPPDVSKGGFAAGVSCIRYVNPFVVFPHHRLANHPGLLGGCQPPHVIWKRGRAQFGLGWRFRRKKEPNPDYVFTISPT